jgi:hypothetical protein
MACTDPLSHASLDMCIATRGHCLECSVKSEPCLMHTENAQCALKGCTLQNDSRFFIRFSSLPAQVRYQWTSLCIHQSICLPCRSVPNFICLRSTFYQSIHSSNDKYKNMLHLYVSSAQIIFFALLGSNGNVQADTQRGTNLPATASGVQLNRYKTGFY